MCRDDLHQVGQGNHTEQTLSHLFGIAVGEFAHQQWPFNTSADAVELLDRNREPRLVVLDEDGQTLRGLLCFNQSSASFCVR